MPILVIFSRFNDELFWHAAAFEEKRKENFDKGQAELERRRKALLELQRQEREERERLEKQEEERKEKIRYGDC